MNISEDYRALNHALHQSKPTYGASGHKWAEWVEDLDDILDYGCGKGTLRKALGRDIAEYDPCIPGKDNEPDRHDYVVCTDVLEHIEPDCLDDVLRHIRSKMKIGGFFVIATRPAKKTLPDGRNAHLIVEPLEWWIRRLEWHFTILETMVDPIEKGEFAVWCQSLSVTTE